VTPIAESSAQQVARQRAFVSDVFHSLSQPLTALQCSLELSLARDQTSQEFSASVEAALQNAERLRQRFLLLRELSEADDPGDVSAPVELRQLLQDLREDLLPICESAGGCFDLTCEPVQVRGNAAKLTRAFFCLLEYLLGRSARASLSVGVERTNGHVEIRMTLSDGLSSAVSSADLSNPISDGEFGIARQTFRAVGGDLALVESVSGRSIWMASLRLAG
jgi:hypothetical protein